MFTGIVEEIGRVQRIRKERGGVRLQVEARKVSRGLRRSSSIAVNGSCLTVLLRSGNSFEVFAVEETLTKTNVGSLSRGSRVNVERPLLFNERLGGHLVSGHVDCVGRITLIEPRKGSWLFHVSFPKKFSRFIIPVGSIAVDGVSLTLAGVNSSSFIVSIIPYTWQNTLFQHYSVNDRVNLEFDLVGKYIERWLTSDRRQSTRQGRVGGKRR